MFDSKPQFDLISVGDTQHDVFLELEEETKVLKDPESGKDYLGLVFAEKIPVKAYKSILAVGNSANVAIGAARLGLKTAFYTHLGNDEIGSEELEIFKKEKVVTDYIVRDKDRPSNFSAVLNYNAERTILVHHEPREYNLPNLAPAKWMYFSSLAPGHEKLHVQIPEYVRKYGVQLGFNPGSFQLEEGVEKLRPILEVCTAMFVNKQEAQTLLGQIDNVKELLRMLREKGPKIAVITDGPDGSYAFDGNSFYFLEVFPASIIERTGTGDSYATGFVSALIYGNGIPEAMRWGTFNAASKIQSIGAREGLLRKEQMEKVLKDNLNFQPRII